MSINWDYAEHCKTAKMYGGPEMYIATIKKDSYNDGVQDAKRRMRPYFQLEAALVSAATLAGVKVAQSIAEYREKRKYDKACAMEAEEILLKNMRPRKIIVVSRKDNAVTSENDEVKESVR